MINAQEALEEDSSKSLRFKETRSSTTSDKGVIDNEKLDLNESTNELPVNLFMKSKRSSVRLKNFKLKNLKEKQSLILVFI